MVFFTCELFNVEESYINKLMTAWRVCSRRALNIHRQTHCDLLTPLVQCKNPLLIIEERIIIFFRKMLNHDDQFIKYTASFTLSNNFSYMTGNLLKIYLNIQSCNYEKLYWNQTIKINSNVEYNWKVSCIKELILIRDQLLCTKFQ